MAKFLRWGDAKDRSTGMCWVDAKRVIWRRQAHGANCAPAKAPPKPRASKP